MNNEQFISFPVDTSKLPDDRYIEVLKYINPRMQRNVDKILRWAAEQPAIKKIIVFGSSVTWNYGAHSDLDIGMDITTDRLEFATITYPVYAMVDCDVDLINITDMEPCTLKDEIESKGVTVYEQGRN